MQEKSERKSNGQRCLIVCDLAQTFLRFRTPIVMALVMRGWEVHVAFSEVRERDEAELDRLPLSWQAIGGSRSSMSPLEVLRHARRVRRLIADYRPNVVFAYQMAMVLGACLATCCLNAVRLVVLFPGLGVLFQPAPGKRLNWRIALARFLTSLAGKRVDVAVFQNRDDHRDLMASGTLRRGCQTVIVPGSGVDLEKYVPTKHPPDPPTFTVIGRLLHSKGYSTFVQAAREIAVRRDRQVRFRIVGGLDKHPDAVSPEEIRVWTEEFGVEYVGEVADVRTELGNSTALVLPTTYMEGLPRTILEAMACGRAVIATDWRGCRDAVADGSTGILVPPRDASALAQAMLRYIDEPNLATEHGRTGRLRAEELYCSKRVGSLMADAIDPTRYQGSKQVTSEQA